MRKLSTSQLNDIQSFLENASETITMIESEDMVEHCRVTGKPLYELMVNGYHRSISSHGECVECKQYHFIDELKTIDGMSRSSWPVRYLGFTCKQCWKNIKTKK